MGKVSPPISRVSVDCDIEHIFPRQKKVKGQRYLAVDEKASHFILRVL